MDGVKRRGLSDAAAGTVLLVVGAACAGLLMSQERVLMPAHLPTLTLPADQVAARMADDRRREQLPAAERSAALEELLMEQGRAEQRGVEDSDRYKRRRRALELGHINLVNTGGKEAALGMRARATARFERALNLELAEDEAKAVIGAMGAVLEKEGAVVNGHVVAPRFVVRTLFKARWNLLHGLVPDDTFEPIEKRAYYGWQALHAPRRPIDRRLTALRAYADKGGTDIDEALGVLLFRARDYRGAATALEKAYRARPSIRLRNYLLGARWAAGYED